MRGVRVRPEGLEYRDVIAFGKVVGATLVTAALACFVFAVVYVARLFGNG